MIRGNVLELKYFYDIGEKPFFNLSNKEIETW